VVNVLSIKRVQVRLSDAFLTRDPRGSDEDNRVLVWLDSRKRNFDSGDQFSIVELSDQQRPGRIDTELS
jgi:hypothetical protein